MRQNTRAIVKVIRDGTVCEKRGRQPIEWHHDDHPERPELRIANLVDDGKPLEVILAEIERCEALCRRCHMRGDGRGDRLAHRDKRGSRNSRARLTAEQVAEIRAAYAADSSHGRQSALARQYGVALPTINHVLRGRSWKA